MAYNRQNNPPSTIDHPLLNLEKVVVVDFNQWKSDPLGVDIGGGKEGIDRRGHIKSVKIKLLESPTELHSTKLYHSVNCK